MAEARKGSKGVLLNTHSAAPTFPIVGIGASAGGLEAFIELFKGLPIDTGMTFVLVQHLSPNHLSQLSSIIQNVTEMGVQEIQDGMVVAPNQIYIIPPNAILEIFHGVLHLQPLPEHHSSLPINTFFTSLARDQGNLAIGVVLSGSGSDGAHGLREIKADGGISIVQEPKTAKYDGMPLAAIAEAIPDFVLDVKLIASELVRISKHPMVRKALIVEDSIPSPEVEQTLSKIFILLRSVTKIDFSNYKYPTIIRRIKRRMVLHRIESLKQYLTFLQTNPPEVHSLFEDLLINVTDFFRDASAFESLKSHVFPKIMKDRAQGAPIRIWVPGCSTGEEVYSIAISLIEYLGENVSRFPIQIYGTDICQSALKIARTGFYPESAASNLTHERLARFFTPDQGGYRINRIIRDCCIFSIQDVTSQPPINRLDLLSCRNLMIYLSQNTQAKLMETFYYALNADGFLLLGLTEGVGTAVRLFIATDKKNKIYSKRNSGLKAIPTKPKVKSDLIIPLKSDGIAEVPVLNILKPFDPIKQAERLVLDRYAPAWVVVNQVLDVTQVRGNADRFIALSSGQPTLNLMKILREGLTTPVRVLIHTVLKENRSERKNGLKVISGGIERAVDVEVAPLSPDGAEKHLLVIFLESAIEIVQTPSSTRKKSKGKPADAKSTEIEKLKHELALAQSSLKSIVEDLNASNEEMQTANEEISSANEELQSTIEELETAKEELQSTNEELTTLNDELSSRNGDLDHLSNDLINVLSNANVSIIMVGADLRIRRFTPMAEKRLKLIATDVGRSLMDINIGFAIENFDEKIIEVVRTMQTIELETRDRQGHWYSIQIRPYRTGDNKIEGAVIVYVNIDDVKIRETQIIAAERCSDGIIQTVRDPLIVLEQDFRVERANQAFYDTFKVQPVDTIGRLFYELGNGQWNLPELRTLLEEVLPKKKEVRDFRVSHTFDQIGKKQIVLNARTLDWKGQTKLLLLISLHDYTALESGKSS